MPINSDLLSSDNFIILFLTLLQLRLFANSNNFLVADWHFNSSELSKFIFYSKQDSRYCSILNVFNFVTNGKGIYSIELITAINKAKAKRFLTASDGDIFYISRTYHSPSIIEAFPQYIPIMNELVDNYLVFIETPEIYLKTLVNINSSDGIAQIDNDFNVFNLQRILREAQIKKYNSRRNLKDSSKE